MSHKEVLYGWFILLALALVTVLFLSEPLSTPTGYAVSLSANPEVSAEKAWDFNQESEYTYNSSAISVNGTAQLVLITTTTSTTVTEINESALLFATEYGDDEDTKNRTTKVNSLGNGNVQLDDGETILEVILGGPLQDNDTVSLYLLSGTDADGRIYLCDDSSGCSSAEYGSLILSGSVSGGWYNLTLTGLPSASATFFIDSPDKIKIDMVQGYVASTRTETSTSTSYPVSGSIETADLQPTDWKRWDTFSVNAQQKGQITNYDYSTDSGSTWAVVPTNLNLSSVVENKIRFKLGLQSNATTTPVIDTLTLAYITQQPCTESWSVQYGSCLKNDRKLKYYTDANECGTASSLPFDNNSYLACDYCALFNCSGSVLQKPVTETKDNKTIYTLDAVSKTNTKLEIEAGAAPAGVEVVEYSYNVKNETPSATSVNRYIDLQSDEPTISSVKIILYYNDSEIAALDENTLKIYYYNETSKVWDALSSVVNTTENYVDATVPHLSLYGLFGEQPSSASGSISSSEGSGGGKRRTETAALLPPNSAVETTLPTKSEAASTLELNAPASETVCEYMVEMSLPDEIVLGESESYEGEVANKGNCAIPELKLGLSPELESKIGLSILQFSNLQPGDKEKFVLIRKKVEQNDLFSATSYVIGSLKAEKSLLGQVLLQGYDETGEIFSRELPVSIVLKNSFPGKELIVLGMVGLVLLMLGVRMWYGESRKKKIK